MTPLPTFWSAQGRELDTTPALSPASVPSRVVACLNVWNDLASLQRTVGSWRPYVDHVIAVDGSYDTVGHELSTDSTREFLRELFGEDLTLLDGAGLSQCAKRTMYLQAGRPGDTLFVIDADETVLNGPELCHLPACDIGWVRMRSPLYQREYGQPRVFQWRENLHYSGRHHWMYHGEHLFCTHQYGGPGYAHRALSLTMQNLRDAARSGKRIAVKRDNLLAQQKIEAPLSATVRTAMSDASLGAREPLLILNYAYRDDGIAPSRFHTAINRTTPHSSVFFKSRPGPFGVPTQFDARVEYAKLTSAVQTCDVVHIHTVTSMADPITRSVPVVFHHHGSLLRANKDKYEGEAIKRQALVLVSNLELLSHTGDYPAFFLPNVVPVARYRALADANRHLYDSRKTFRICHSPTRQDRKGTKQFITACTNLARRGIHVEPVLIENQTHHDTLFIKSTCHAAFDSFWLGMQCSGLEAAAMGLPVIAGDPTVRDRYVTHFSECPYTYANDQTTLEQEIEALVMDENYREHETMRVCEYVVANHDESAVALTYLDYLDMAFGWREAKKRNGSLPKHSMIRKEATV